MSADFAPDPPEPLPIASAEDRLGDQGMRIVDRIVSEDLGRVFRDQTRKDYGIDALIELEELEWRAYNERATGGGIKDLMLFVVGDDPESVRLSLEARELVEKSPNLRLYRLLYDDEWLISLTEIDANDQPVEFWPGADEPGL